MRMTMNRLLILFLVLVTLPEVKAQQRLTLEECRRLALEQSEEMKIARFRVEKVDVLRPDGDNAPLALLHACPSGHACQQPLPADVKRQVYIAVYQLSATGGGREHAL